MVAKCYRCGTIASMSTLGIKNVPDELPARLKEQAELNRRSVTMEAITLLERGVLPVRRAPTLGPPIKLKGGPLTTAEVERWIARGRD